MFAQLNVTSDGGLLAKLQLRPTLSQQIKVRQVFYEQLSKRVHQVEQGVQGDFVLNNERILCFRGRLLRA